MSEIEIADQLIEDEGDSKKYRTELPNLYDDSDLDPFEFRLLAHYKRVGYCYESTRTTAAKCRMSVGRVVASRKALAVKHKLIDLSTDVDYGTIGIKVMDKWRENFEHYSSLKRSPHERERSPHELKNKPRKKVARERTPRETPRAIAVFREKSKRYQNKAVWSEIEKTITDFELWGNVVAGYILMGWNPSNVAGMLDYYRRGEVPKVKQTQRQAQQQKIVDVDAEFERVNGGRKL